MSESYSIAEARDRLPALVHEAEDGKPVQLTRHGKPVAFIISSAHYKRLAEPRPDFWAGLEAWWARTDLAALKGEEVFANVRDPSPGRDFGW